MNLVDLSKEISYALRHAPWEYELELDEKGKSTPFDHVIVYACKQKSLNMLRSASCCTIVR